MNADDITFQDLLARRQAGAFVGRREPLERFGAGLTRAADDPARFSIFWIHGDGGVGKSFLAQRMRRMALQAGMLTAYLDESVFGIPDTMNAIAAQFERQGHSFKRFTRRYGQYSRHRWEVESDRSAPPSAAAFMTMTAVRVGLGAAKAAPGIGGLVSLADPAALSEQAEQFREFLVGKFQHEQDVRMLLSPVEAISPDFAFELARVGRHRRIALFFDTYERTGPVLDDWLTALLAGRYGALPPDIVCSVAGRKPADKNRWAPFLPAMADIPLTPFTDGEARELLTLAEITEPQVVKVILAVSGRLPLLLAMLAEQHPTTPADVRDPGGDAVDRFLRWEEDGRHRDLAVAAALPRWVDRDVFNLVARGLDAAEGADLFEWLRAQPFVAYETGRCRYHEVVRDSMIRLARGRSPQLWREQHRLLADQHRRWARSIDERECWDDSAWLEHFLEETYHRLCGEPLPSLPEALERTVRACAQSDATRSRWTQMIAQAGADCGAPEVKKWSDGLQAASLENDNGIALFTFLLGSRLLPPGARGEALRLRGRSHRLLKHFPDAVADLERAVALNPSDVATLVDLAETHRRIGHKEQALAGFTSAIELAPDDADLWANRGWCYIWSGPADEEGDYSRAVADFSRAIAMDPENVMAYSGRGETYRRMTDDERALSDLTRAVDLGPDSGDLSNRGWVYIALERWEEASADLTRAVEADADNSWAVAGIGEMNYRMGRYELAISTLTRAIDMGFAFPWAAARRAEACLRTGRHDQALSDLNHIIEHHPEDHWSVYVRALVHRSRGEHPDSRADLDRAVELARQEEAVYGFTRSGYINLVTYEAARGDLPAARRELARLLAGEPSPLVRRACADDLRFLAAMTDEEPGIAELLTRLEDAC